MFWLEAGPLAASSTNIVYLTRPKINWIKIIAGVLPRHTESVISLTEERTNKATWTRREEAYLYPTIGTADINTCDPSVRGGRRSRRSDGVGIQHAVHTNRG